MKMIISEIDSEGLISLMGKKITLFCANYFYTGRLIGVNKDCVKIEDPAIIYNTGDFKNANYEEVESLGVKFWYIQNNSIESFGELK